VRSTSNRPCNTRSKMCVYFMRRELICSDLFAVFSSLTLPVPVRVAFHDDFDLSKGESRKRSIGCNVMRVIHGFLVNREYLRGPPSHNLGFLVSGRNSLLTQSVGRLEDLQFSFPEKLIIPVTSRLKHSGVASVDARSLPSLTFHVRLASPSFLRFSSLCCPAIRQGLARLLSRKSDL
jgi:hypothetical protein